MGGQHHVRAASSPETGYATQSETGYATERTGKKKSQIRVECMGGYLWEKMEEG